MWDAGHYLKYSEERSRPFIDLLGRVRKEQAASIVDLGCGPGNLNWWSQVWQFWDSSPPLCQPLPAVLTAPLITTATDTALTTPTVMASAAFLSRELPLSPARRSLPPSLAIWPRMVLSVRLRLARMSNPWRMAAQLLLLVRMVRFRTDSPVPAARQPSPNKLPSFNR